MNKYFQIVSLLFITNLILTNSSYGQSLPKIGDTWKGSLDSRGTTYLPPPLDFQNRIEFKYKGMNFDIAVKERTIVWIATTDTSFKINKTKYVGKPLSFFKNKDSVKLVRGWAHYLTVEEGWYVAFSFDKITDTSKSIFLFQVENSIVTR